MNDVVEQYGKDHPKREVAVVGLRDEEGNVFLVRTHKLTEWWQPVGGGVDAEDKSPEEAAVREIQEELGISIDPNSLTLILVTPYDFGEGSVYFYEALVDRESLIMKIDEIEIIDHKWFSPQESLELKAFPATAAFLQKLAG